MSPCLPKAKTHIIKPLVIATANEHHSVMMHLIVEYGVDPVLNDDTQEKPDNNSPEEVNVYKNSAQNTLFWALAAGEGDDHAGLLAALSLSGRVDLGKRDACGSPLHYAAVARNSGDCWGIAGGGELLWDAGGCGGGGWCGGDCGGGCGEDGVDVGAL